jgi:hypothetical protein
MASSAGVPCGKPWDYIDAGGHAGWVETWWRAPRRGMPQVGDPVIVVGRRYIVKLVAHPDAKETQPPPECHADPSAVIVRIVGSPEL